MIRPLRHSQPMNFQPPSYFVPYNVVCLFVCLLALTQVIIEINALSFEWHWDTLTLQHSPADDPDTTAFFSLDSGNVTSLILPGGTSVFTFCSDDIQEQGGFALIIYTSDANGETWGVENRDNSL